MKKITKWQPISTAPKDRTTVLVSDGECVALAYYEKTKYEKLTGWFVHNNGDYNDGGYGHDYKMGDSIYDKEPTHWLPISEFPRGENR